LRESDLPSPAIGGKGFHLRRIAADAISSIQKTAPAYADGYHPNAATLKAFFIECAAKVDEFSPEPEEG
jgi:hypothetical protein